MISTPSDIKWIFPFFCTNACNSICWILLYLAHKLHRNGLIIENVLVDLHSRYSENNLMQQC